jgi:hypothetical protein
MKMMRRRRATARAGLVVGLIAVCLGVFGVQAPPAGADGPHGPDTCLWGYVWRDAGPDDHVCVTPEARDQAARDNELADSRRNPDGGEWGPDTCLDGYIWREAFPADHVCVTPERYDQVQAENADGPDRRARDTLTDTDELRLEYRRGTVDATVTLDLNPNGAFSFRGRVENDTPVRRNISVACVVPLLDGGAMTFGFSRSVYGRVGAAIPLLGRNNVVNWDEPDSSGQVANHWTKIPRDRAADCRMRSSLDVGGLIDDIMVGYNVTRKVVSFFV